MDGVKALMCDHCHVSHLQTTMETVNVIRQIEVNYSGLFSPCTLGRNTHGTKGPCMIGEQPLLVKCKVRDHFSYNINRQAVA